MRIATPLALSLAPTNASARVLRIAQGERQRVVMAAEQDALLLLRVPADDDVGHRHAGAIPRVAGGEALQLDLPAEFFEVAGEQFLLAGHGGRAAAARPEGAELLQVVVGARAVEADGGPLAPFDVGDRSPKSEAEEEHRKQKERLQGEAWRRLAFFGVFHRFCHFRTFLGRTLFTLPGDMRFTLPGGGRKRSPSPFGRGPG